MNHVFKITSLAGLCFLFHSLGAQTPSKGKSTTRIIEIQDGDTIRNETIVKDSDPDHDPNGQKESFNFNFGFNSADFEKNMELAMRKMEKSLKELENVTMNIDISNMENGMEGMMKEIEKLSDIKIDTKTRKRGGKEETEIIIRGPKGNNQVIILDRKGNVKTRSEFDKKQARKYADKQKQERLTEEQRRKKLEEQLKKEAEKEKKKWESDSEADQPGFSESGHAPRFMMSTDDNKIYNFEIETGSDKEVEIEIRDENDKLLLKEVEPQGRKFERQINLGKFGAGTYSIRLTQDGKEISNHEIVIGE